MGIFRYTRRFGNCHPPQNDNNWGDINLPGISTLGFDGTGGVFGPSTFGWHMAASILQRFRPKRGKQFRICELPARILPSNCPMRLIRSLSLARGMQGSPAYSAPQFPNCSERLIYDSKSNW
ncbi:hypothetical protein CEXT_231041 [Caerostris extrusa]|uniref:Uncharacterized protein n=1 Tax=Caerostris extrusa TaxID=172846 RepID=A0AAV4RXI0_CAEEX|nr:hypothetical protein CEXT_231041 [Caerostris extrusa]